MSNGPAIILKQWFALINGFNLAAIKIGVDDTRRRKRFPSAKRSGRNNRRFDSL
jgi:hypothetical protein